MKSKKLKAESQSALGGLKFTKLLPTSHFPLLTSQKGIALLIALGTMLVILIIGSLVLYLIIRGLNVTSGQSRYETTYEAAVAALEIGKAKAESLNINVLWSTTDTIQLRNYSAIIEASKSGGGGAMPISGNAMKFARAIAGPGSTMGTVGGGFRLYYVSATALGPGGEKVSLEAIERFTIQTE